MSHVYAGQPDGRQAAAIDAPVSRFRPTYRALTPEEKALHDTIKVQAEELERLITSTPPGRCQALALTALEETVMWAVKGLTS